MIGKGWMASLALGLAVGASPAVAQIPQAQVTGGRVAGVVADGLSQFKGIPFAAPPVGDLRWKPPQPIKPWSGVRQTTAFGAGCMQDPVLAKRMGADVPLAEDCLFIDVWTPAHRADEKLPVIAWIYGGGFNGGMTSVPLYDGANFAKKGVVFVSISYRVGPFGFLATPELSRESGHGSGAYGLLDQIAGLKWVQANIGQFGGDPAKVTILGHSAGGFAVSMLAASPLAKGLFRGIISESGANFAPPRDAAWTGSDFQTLKFAEAADQAWLQGLGAKSLAEARALPAQTLEEAQRAKGAPRFWPPLDGYVLTADQELLWRQHRFNDTPILIGHNSDEAAAFGVRKIDPAGFEAEVKEGFGKEAAAILAVYPHATDAQAARSSTQLRTDTTFAWAVNNWARLQAAQGKGKAYVYLFDKPSARDPDGSPHGQELGLAFGNVDVPGRPPAAADDRAISQQMQGYWVNFAMTGDPNGSGLPQWPAYSTSQPLVLRIGVKPGPAPTPDPDRIKALDHYYDWRRGGGN